MTKRKKDAVLLSVTDSNELVSVDRQLLIESGCRLGLALKYDDVTESHMTKAMLLTFMRSLLHGQLSLGRGVSYQEALTTFQFEGISIGGVPPAIAPGSTTAHHATSISEEIVFLSERLANHLITWPRLAKTCRNSIFGKGSVSATPTRVWVRLLTRPQFRIRGDGSHHSALIAKWPYWLSESLAFIGSVHDELVIEGVIQPHACDETALKLMSERLGSREYLSHSMHDGLSTTHEVKRWRVRMDRFLHDVRSVLLEPSDYSQEAHVFAKTCLDLCLEEMDVTPSHGHIYTYLCEKGAERGALAKALKARGVQLVTWANQEQEVMLNPLGFPHMWAGANDVGPCALLDLGRD
jgi:hypothetical protein